MTTILLYEIGVLLLALIMIVCEIYRREQIPQAFYRLLLSKISNKRSLVTILSALFGILPIHGRIIVSAPLLDPLRKKKEDPSNWGIIAYLASHHYYLWSPLEKSVIITMSLLGIGYSAFLLQMLPILIVSFLFTGIYLIFFLKEEDIEIEEDSGPILWGKIFDFSLVFVAVILAILDISIVISLSILAFYLLIRYRISLREAITYINWRTILVIAGVIFCSGVVRMYTPDLQKMAQSEVHSVIIAGLLVFLSSLILGSSARYSALIGVVIPIFGLQYLAFFYCMGFMGYLLSPAHQCVVIANRWFNTPIYKLYLVISIWCLALALTTAIFFP